MASWFIGFPAQLELELKPPKGVRILAKEDRHLTVAFFGQCGETRARKAFALAPRPPTVEVTLGDTVMLGRQERPCAMAVTIEEGRSELESFIKEWRNTLRKAAGLRAEQGTPLPHITLARVGRRAAEDQYEAAVRWWQRYRSGPLRHRLTRLALFAPAEPDAKTSYCILGERHSILKPIHQR